MSSASRYLDEDGAGLAAVLDAVDDLAVDPEPLNSTSLGLELRRLRVGRYRALYEVSDVITVIHIGRLG